MKHKILLTLVFSVVLVVLMQGQGQGEPSERKTGDVVTFDLPGGATIEMVWIKPGTFMMGWEERLYERPVHEVTISRGFWLGKYEITQVQWESVMGTRPWVGQRFSKNVRDNPDHPAVYISWDDVQAFVAKLNQAEGAEVYRLPTEAEWEYACRAGTTTRWSFGDDESQLGNYAWYDDNAWNVGEAYAHAVGTKLPNPWGLYDMHGNVWEWVQDWYGSYSGDPETDPAGPATGSARVVRSGTFFGNWFWGSSLRGSRAPDYVTFSFGARLLRMEVETPVSPSTWGQVKSLLK